MPRESAAACEKRVHKILPILERLYPEPAAP